MKKSFVCCFVFLILPYLMVGCKKDGNYSDDCEFNQTIVPMEKIFGTRKIYKVIQYRGAAHKSNADVYIGKTIKIHPRKFIQYNGSLCDSPRYKYKAVYYPKTEGEVPSNLVKRTSAFYGYKYERERIDVIYVYDSTGNNQYSFEYLNNGDIVVMTESYILIAKHVFTNADKEKPEEKQSKN